jgi:hypothetical protein
MSSAEGSTLFQFNAGQTMPLVPRTRTVASQLQVANVVVWIFEWRISHLDASPRV